MASEKAETTANVTPMPKDEKKTPRQLVLTGPDGATYTLQFNRKVVLNMQRNGFTLDLDRLYMCARDLIAGAFKMHHSWLKWDDIVPHYGQETDRREERVHGQADQRVLSEVLQHGCRRRRCTRGGHLCAPG